MDTGATISILPLELWAQIRPADKTPLAPTNMKIRAGNDTEVDVRGTSDVLIKIDGVQYPFTYYVCADATAAILGTDFQSRYDLYMRPAHDKVYIEGTKEIPCFEPKNCKGTSTVRLFKTYWVAPNEEIIVPARIQKSQKYTFDNHNCLVEMAPRCTDETGVIACRSVVRPVRNKIPLRMINCSSEYVMLKKNKVVGLLQHAVQVANIDDPPEDESIPCTCQCDCEEDGVPQGTNKVLHCCHQLKRRETLFGKYDYVTINLHDASGETFKEFEADTSIPEHVRQLYADSLANLQSNSQKSRLANVLREYADCFAKHSDDIGRTDLVKHHIDTGENRPVRQRCRRFCRAHIQVIRDHVAKLSANGTIRPSDSNWAANPVIVDKKTGEKRLCIDYRGLNAVTLNPDSYMLPRIDDTLDALTGARYFCTLDLIQGYHQVELTEESKPKTAFYAPYCNPSQWEYNYMPFGLIKAPRTFQRLMDRVIQGLEYISALAYLDDVIVFGTTIDQTMDRMVEVLERLRTANLKLKPKKCLLFQTEVKYLGHVISSEGVKTDPDKVQAVLDWHPPRTVKQVRSFLGMVNYYSRFIPYLAQIADPLHLVTKKGGKFFWGNDQEQAFEDLKKALASAPVMSYPNSEGMFILDTDASDLDMGAVLSQMQEQENGEEIEKPIAYSSKKFDETQRFYCARRRELLAIVTMVAHFDVYLRGVTFLIRTDHASLKYIRTLTAITPQFFRWVLALEEYSYKLEIRKGVLHSNADAMSRGCHGKQCICEELVQFERKHNIRKGMIIDDGLQVIQMFQCPVVLQNSLDQRCSERTCMFNSYVLQVNYSLEELRVMQEADDQIRPVLLLFRQNSDEKPAWNDVSAYSAATKSYVAEWKRLTLREQVLYRKWESQDGARTCLQLLVPKQLQYEFCEKVHGGPLTPHLGRRKTLSVLQHTCYWYRMHSDVGLWILACEKCQARRPLVPKPKAKMVIKRSGEQNERVAMDICGPLVETADRNIYILVVTDHFSKHTEAYGLPDQTAETIARTIVKNWFLRHGPPVELHTDQGTNFGSLLLYEICKVWKIYKTRTSPYHPQGDGQCERYNRTMLNMVYALVSNSSELWDVVLPYATFAYNCTIHEATGFTPNFLWYGRELRNPSGPALPDVEERVQRTYGEYALETKRFLDTAFAVARDNLGKAVERQKEYHDRNARQITYAAGDPVWLEDHSRHDKGTAKAKAKFNGPWWILAVLSDVNFRIQLTKDGTPKVIHHNRIKPYVFPPNSLNVGVPEWVVRASPELAQAYAEDEILRAKRSIAPRKRPLICCKKRAKIVKSQKQLKLKQLHSKGRRPLKPILSSSAGDSTCAPAVVDATATQRTRTGREVRRPERFADSG